MSNKKRWLLSSAIVLMVVAISTGIVLNQLTETGDITVLAVSDNAGGAVIAWKNDKGIYAQRVDSTGQTLWKDGGVFIVKNPDGGWQGTRFNLTSDGLAGAFLTWADRRDLPDDRDDPDYYNPTPVYTQRINADGNLLWDKGILTGVIKRALAYSLPRVVPDGTGGAIIAWNDYEPYCGKLSNDYLRVSKLDPYGNPVWDPDGILVVSSSPYRDVDEEERMDTAVRRRPTYEGRHQGLVSDGSGGVLVYWEEETGTSTCRALAQRVDASGNLVWPEAVQVDSGRGYCPESAISDGSGGAFIVFKLNESNSVRIHHILDSGEIDCTMSLNQNLISMVSDESGGIIIPRHQSGELAQDHSSSLYLRRLDKDGNALWNEDALVYKEETPHSQSLHITDDGIGGALVTRTVSEEPIFSGAVLTQCKVITQRVDSEGNPLWAESGIEVFTSPDFLLQGFAGGVNDGSGGAIVFTALREKSNRGDMVCVQRLSAEGTILWGDGIRVDR